MRNTKEWQNPQHLCVEPGILRMIEHVPQRQALTQYPQGKKVSPRPKNEVGCLGCMPKPEIKAQCQKREGIPPQELLDTILGHDIPNDGAKMAQFLFGRSRNINTVLKQSSQDDKATEYIPKRNITMIIRQAKKSDVQAIVKMLANDDLGRQREQYHGSIAQPVL